MLQLLLSHVFADKINTRLEAYSLDFLEVGRVQRLPQEIDAAHQVSNHEPVFGHVVKRLRSVASLDRSLGNQFNLARSRRRIVQQIEEYFMRKFGLLEL